MKFKKFFLLITPLIFTTTIINGCSSSSQTIRYSSSPKVENNLTENGSSRYSFINKSPVEDTLSNFEEDVFEYQDSSDLPNEESLIDITEIMKKIEEKSGSSKVGHQISSQQEQLLMEIIKYLDTPYKFGGNSRNGIDCSAFTQNVFKNTNLYELNRSAREQFKQGVAIEDKTDLNLGDLVFFNTRRRVKPGHVGIYIGGNLFVHASSKLGVTVSSLDHDYYSKRYMGARRMEVSQVIK